MYQPKPLSSSQLSLLTASVTSSGWKGELRAPPMCPCRKVVPENEGKSQIRCRQTHDTDTASSCKWQCPRFLTLRCAETHAHEWFTCVDVMLWELVSPPSTQTRERDPLLPWQTLPQGDPCLAPSVCKDRDVCMVYQLILSWIPLHSSAKTYSSLPMYQWPSWRLRNQYALFEAASSGVWAVMSDSFCSLRSYPPIHRTDFSESPKDTSRVTTKAHMSTHVRGSVVGQLSFTCLYLGPWVFWCSGLHSEFLACP